MDATRPDRSASWLGEAQAELRKLLGPQSVRTRADYVEMGRLSALLDESAHRSESPWTAYDEAEFRALLAEYETLRQESLNTITTRAQTIVLGLAAVGALYAGPFALGDPAKQRTLTTAVFSFAVPIVSLLVLLVWVGEAMRMKRVSEYLASDIEAKINRKCGRLVLVWEACLKTGVLPRDAWLGPSVWVLALFALIAGVSPLVGLYVTETPFLLWGGGRPLWELWAPWLLCGLVAWYLLAVRGRFMPGDTVVSSVLDRVAPPSSSSKGAAA